MLRLATRAVPRGLPGALRRFRHDIDTVEEMRNPPHLSHSVWSMLADPTQTTQLQKLLATEEKLHLFSVYKMTVFVRKMTNLNKRMVYIIAVLVHAYFVRQIFFPEGFVADNPLRQYVDNSVLKRKFAYFSAGSIAACIAARQLNQYVLRNTVRSINYVPRTKTYEVEIFGKSLKARRTIELKGDDVTYSTKNKDDYLRMTFVDDQGVKRTPRLIGMFLNKALMQFLKKPENADAIAAEAEKLMK